MSLGWVSTPSSPIMPQERRIGDVVVDDEAHVDGDRPVGRVDGDRLDVAADRRLGVVQRDVVVAVEGVGGAQAADPAADDRDAHQSGRPARPSARASVASVSAMPAAASRPIRANVPPRNGCEEPPDAAQPDVGRVVDDRPVAAALEADVVDGIDARSRADEDDPVRALEVA